MNTNPWGSRTNEESQQEVYAAAEAARQMGVPIHTIGLNFDGNLAVEYINNISAYGLSFETSNAEDIPGIIAAFFYQMIAAPQPEEEPEEPEPAEIIEEPEEIKEPPPVDDIEKPAPPQETYYPRGRNYLVTVLIAALFLGLNIFLIAKAFSPKRVFTGKLIIDIDGHSQTKNLIEYGNRTNLFDLSGGKVDTGFSAAVLVPCPTAPSHLPQLLLKCKKAGIVFTKDFLEQNAAKGIVINVGTEISAKSDLQEILIRFDAL
jgi:hypothetical protein